MLLASRLIAALAVAVFATAASADERFRVERDTLIFDTETGADAEGIRFDDVDRMIALLRENEGLTTVRLNSSGGGYYAAFDLAAVLIDFELDTEIVDECASACAFVFLGGKRRTMWRGAKLGFHRTFWSAENIASYYQDRRDDWGWQSAFDFASWNYEDTQLEVYDRLNFMTDRGVSASFAIETLRTESADMWYPYRLRLIAAGVLTE